MACEDFKFSGFASFVFINSCCLPGLFSYTSSATHYSKGFKQVACLLAGDGSHWCIGAVQHLCYEVNRRCHKHGIAYQIPQQGPERNWNFTRR